VRKSTSGDYALLQLLLHVVMTTAVDTES